MASGSDSMQSPNSDMSAALRGQGPGYAYLWPSTAAAATTTTTIDTHCHCSLCAHDRPSPAVPSASIPEFHAGSRSRASPKEEEAVTAQEGPHARRTFLSQSRRKGSREEGLERNGVNGAVPSKNQSRKVDFYLGPDHCSVLGDTTPGFPREWDPCYSPPSRWNWPVAEPCREHCVCTREVWPEWERTPPPPPLPSPPCCYSPERRPSNARHMPNQPSPEFRGYLRHREAPHGAMVEPCWECMRDYYWREAHRPDLIAVDRVYGCGANGQCHQAVLSPMLSYGPEPMGRQHQLQQQHQHQRLNRQKSSEHGTFNRPTTPGHRTFFSTEVPPAKLRVPYDEEPGSCRATSVNGPQRRESKLETHKQKEEKEKENTSGPANQHQDQGSVREQIRRVVGDLEEVLGGLKQVHLEMKEVVQQIDVLTSSIDPVEDEPCIRISHESVQQQTVRHEVKALVHRPADANTSQKPKHQQLQQERQPQGVNGHPAPTIPTPNPSSKPSTCHPSVTQRGHTTSGDLPKVTALIPGQEASKDRSKMNGTCVAPRPPRDRVKDAQRRRIELSSPSISLTPNGSTASIKSNKPPPYPNHNGRVETLHKDSDVPMVALRTAAQTGKGRQVSTAV